MEKIRKHIKSLLQDIDCVVLPSFGGLIASAGSAHYSANERLFLPPKSMRMRFQTILALTLLLHTLSVSAQDGFKWLDPQESPFQVIEGLAFPDEGKGSYARFPAERMTLLPQGVSANAVCSAGLSLRFHTDASEIRVSYTATSGKYAMHHMPSTGVSGLDLYATDKKGHRMVCHAKYGFGEAVNFTYHNLTYHDKGGYDFELYLPLYNGVKSLKIGVPESAEFHFLEATKEQPVLVYGTSIAQGACASRPAMAWTNILKRELHLPFVNWGFSGSGRMEPEMFDMMAEVNARLFIIDCMPNMNDMPEQIVPRLIKGIHTLRAKTEVPILIVEHDGYTGEEINEKSRAQYQKTNEECQKAYQQLRHEGVKNLWYLSHKNISMSPEATVDDTHASDLGMTIYAQAYARKISKILHLKPGKKH